MHSCDESDRDKFYELGPGVKRIIEPQWKNLNCVDRVEDMKLKGHTKTFQGKMIVIDVKPCSGIHCKSDEEITAFYKSSAILLALNT